MQALLSFSHRCLALGLTIALIAIVGTFFYTQLLKAAMMMPCCADDAYFSLLSKELALHFRYALPISSEQVSLFDSRIGSGPALILPGALAIWAFGAKPWTTSVVAILLLLVPLIGAAVTLARRMPITNALLYCTIAMLAFMAITRLHDLYSAFLGEGPVLAWLVLGAAILATSENRLSRIILAGICLAAALLTKYVALSAALGITGTWFFANVCRDRLRAAIPASILFFAVAIPLLAFEAVKLGALGAHGYAEYWRGFFAYANLLHQQSPPDRIGTFLSIASEQFYFDAETVIVAALSFCLLIYLAAAGPPRSQSPLFGIMLFAGAVAQCIYALFLSNLWLRYVWIGIVFFAFAIPAPILFLRLRYAVAASVVVFAVIATPRALQRFYIHQAEQANSALGGERAILFREIANRPDLPLASEYWQTIFDIIYLLETERRWFTSSNPQSVAKWRALYISHEWNFLPEDDPIRLEISSRCTRIHPELRYYRVAVCGG